MPGPYERPKITTIRANRILEMIGPVSCGSGGNHVLPIFGDVDPADGWAGGYRSPGG